jgi:hypothetical protein
VSTAPPTAPAVGAELDEVIAALALLAGLLADRLSEIDVPCAFIGMPNVRDLKVSAIPVARCDVEAPDINHAHGAGQ